MPVITVNDIQHPLRLGQNRLGSGDEADVRVDPNDGAAPGIQAIVEVVGNARAIIRRAGSTATVRVNGVALVDPTPLMHGDKVEIAGRELLYADDTKAGNTAYVSSSDIVAAGAKRPGTARATTATGGRLVSLVDGREYIIPASGIVIGRDASAGVVVPEHDVSRRHAEVAPVESGYELRDFSSNGVCVNGAPIDRAHLLSRADVIRVGSEEFRFYADVRAATPSLEATMAHIPAQPRPTPPSPAAPTPPPGAAVEGNARPVLAILEIMNAGPTQGQQFELHVPLVHIGRGAHNDVVLLDDSVSETHAKLYRRDDGWHLADVGSTNGTYVSDHRLPSGGSALSGASELRFGGVKMIFRLTDASPAAASATRAIAGAGRSAARSASAAPAVIPAPVAATAPDARSSSQGVPAWVWGIVVIAIGSAIAFFLLNR